MTKKTGSAPTVGADPLTRMLAVVAELASPHHAGRRVGTTGGRAAANWLADHLTQLGAAVEIDRFEAPGAVRDVYGTPELSWGTGAATDGLVFRRDFCEHLASADRPTVHRGRLARAEEADVAGAWVLDDGFSADRVAMLAAAGAAGVLVPRGTDEAGWMPKMISGPAPAALPVLAVRTELYERMAAAVRSGSAWAAGNVPIRTADVNGANVYGRFRSGPGILLTAHFDGVGDDPDDTRFPAAADNASGVAVVIEAAHQLHQRLPDTVGLAVALLDGEEAGALGSAHHAPRVEAGNQVINLDGIAALGQAAAVEAGGPAHALLAALDQAGRATGVALKPGAVPSDNRRYAAAGLASIGIGMGIPGYQTPAETVERVDPSTLDAAVRLVVATVAPSSAVARREGDRLDFIVYRR